MTKQRIKFKTAYNNKWKYSNSGNPIITEYVEITKENGEKVLQTTGETNIYEQIQHEAEGVTIKEMLEMYNYDYTLLKEKAENMNYSDTTDFENNILENLENLEKLEKLNQEKLKILKKQEAKKEAKKEAKNNLNLNLEREQKNEIKQNNPQLQEHNREPSKKVNIPEHSRT